MTLQTPYRHPPDTLQGTLQGTLQTPLQAILEVPEGVPGKCMEGPFGAKGAGEGSMLPTAPAIRNAIHDATGVWINSLPITRERVLDALRNKDCN